MWGLGESKHHLSPLCCLPLPPPTPRRAQEAKQKELGPRHLPKLPGPPLNQMKRFAAEQVGVGDSELDWPSSVCLG